MLCNVGGHPGSRGRDMNTNEGRASAAWPGEGSTRFLPLSFYKNFFFNSLKGGYIPLAQIYAHTKFQPYTLNGCREKRLWAKKGYEIGRIHYQQHNTDSFGYEKKVFTWRYLTTCWLGPKSVDQFFLRKLLQVVNLC